jgi:hypothetical protein
VTYNRHPGAGPDHRSVATPHVFLHAHEACAAGGVLRQEATVRKYAPRVRLTQRAQKFALFSGKTLDVLAPLHLSAHFIHGRDPALPNLGDTGIGHQEILHLLNGLPSPDFAELHVHICGDDSRTLHTTTRLHEFFDPTADIEQVPKAKKPFILH